MKTYLFLRAGECIPIDLSSDQEAKHVAEANEGVSRVQTLDGTVVWADNNRLNG